MSQGEPPLRYGVARIRAADESGFDGPIRACPFCLYAQPAMFFKRLRCNAHHTVPVDAGDVDYPLR
eukprot:859372-Lingulodinium_polyedra.AAC.1